MDIQCCDGVVIRAGMAGATAAAHLAVTCHVAVRKVEDSAGCHTIGRSVAIQTRTCGSPDGRILTATSRGFSDAPPAGFATAALAFPRASLHLTSPGQVPALDAVLAAAPERSLAPEVPLCDPRRFATSGGEEAS